MFIGEALELLEEISLRMRGVEEQAKGYAAFTLQEEVKGMCKNLEDCMIKLETDLEEVMDLLSVNSSSEE